MESIHLRVDVVSQPVARIAMLQHPDTYALLIDLQDPLTDDRMCGAAG